MDISTVSMGRSVNQTKGWDEDTGFGTVLLTLIRRGERQKTKEGGVGDKGKTPKRKLSSQFSREGWEKMGFFFLYSKFCQTKNGLGERKPTKIASVKIRHFSSSNCLFRSASVWLDSSGIREITKKIGSSGFWVRGTLFKSNPSLSVE